MTNFLLTNPEWIDSRLLSSTKLDDITESIFEETSANLSNFRSDRPLVSIVIPAYNEELSIIRTLYSLSKNKTTFPVEIIVVNNNSTDRTQAVLDRLNVKSCFQSVPGWGPARQMGLEKAQGKYVLTADSDCFYPPSWIQTLTTALMKGDVTCVYGGYSFLGTAENPRWKFHVYESLRKIILEIRQFKRPYLNARGLNMGFVKDIALKKGYIYKKIRGEDGRMCFDLMQHGKVKFLRSQKINVWTPPRTLKSDGGLVYSFARNVLKEMSRFQRYFKTHAPHDTHASANDAVPELNLVKSEQNAVKQVLIEKPSDKEATPVKAA